MKNDIHRHLDGDIPADALEGEDRTIVDEWDRMVSTFRQAAPRSGTPQWLEQRVMAEIDSLPARGPLYRLFDWLVSPAPLRVSPLVAGLAAVGIVLAVMLPGRSAPQADVGPSAAGAASEVIYVQFLRSRSPPPRSHRRAPAIFRPACLFDNTAFFGLERRALAPFAAPR
jgi:hypothetical protein